MLPWVTLKSKCPWNRAEHNLKKSILSWLIYLLVFQQLFGTVCSWIFTCSDSLSAFMQLLTNSFSPKIISYITSSVDMGVWNSSIPPPKASPLPTQATLEEKLGTHTGILHLILVCWWLHWVTCTPHHSKEKPLKAKKCNKQCNSQWIWVTNCWFSGSCALNVPFL